MVLLSHSLYEASFIEFLLQWSQSVFPPPLLTVAADQVTAVTGNQITSATKRTETLNSITGFNICFKHICVGYVHIC